MGQTIVNPSFFAGMNPFPILRGFGMHCYLERALVQDGADEGPLFSNAIGMQVCLEPVLARPGLVICIQRNGNYGIFMTGVCKGYVIVELEAEVTPSGKLLGVGRKHDGDLKFSEFTDQDVIDDLFYAILADMQNAGGPHCFWDIKKSISCV